MKAYADADVFKDGHIVVVKGENVSEYVLDRKQFPTIYDIFDFLKIPAKRLFGYGKHCNSLLCYRIDLEDRKMFEKFTTKLRRYGVKE